MKKIKLTALLLTIILLSSCKPGPAETSAPASGQTQTNGTAQTDYETPFTDTSDPSQTGGQNTGSGNTSAGSSTPSSTGVAGSTSNNVTSVKTPTPVVKTPSPTPKTTSNPGVYIPEPGTYTKSISIRLPQTSGTQVTNNGATIDTGNASQGYVMVKKTSSTKTKVSVEWTDFDNPDNKKTYQKRYLLSNTNTFYTIPLQMGKGNYTIMIAQNTVGDDYVVIAQTTVSVTTSPEYTLYPNILVNYNASSSCIKKAFDLCVNAKNDLECVAAIYNFITTNIEYDYDKAEAVSSGRIKNHIPNPDDTLKTKKGICFDYASLMAAMLRAKGIPTRLVIGIADGRDHAWNEVYIENVGWIAVEIKSNGGWKLLDSTFGTDYTGSRIDKVKYTSTEYY